MRYYDRSGRRVPAPRHDVVPSGTMTTVTVLLLLAFLAVVVSYIVKWYQTYGHKTYTTDTPKTHDSMTMTHTYNGESIRIYVITDPDTQVQYLVTDRGGICRREPRDEV